jgi:hypothetical protein
MVPAVLPLRFCAMVVLAVGFASPAESQVYGQSFQVTVATGQPTVGDTVTLSFRVRLDERDLLLDTVPQPLGVLPEGIRILSIDKLARTPDRIFKGSARLAFYRPGRQPVPVFMLPFMRIVEGVQRATMASDSAFVVVGSVLPAGNPPLKDIREIELNRGPNLLPLIAMGSIALAGLAAYFYRKRRRPVAALPSAAPALALPSTPYILALAQLDRIEREHWPNGGYVPRHYEEIVNVLREYLEAREGLPARERTTEELLWALPPHLAEGGFREMLGELLDEADLVKFAQLLPGLGRSERFLERSRLLLHGWHGAAAPGEVAGAIR